MTSNNSNHKWYHFGRWVEPVLTVPLWLDLKKDEIEFDIIQEMKVLDFNNYLLKEDLKKVNEFVKEKIIEDRKWFDKFFSICEERANKILSFKDKDDLKGLLEASKEGLSTSYLTILLDTGFVKYIEELSRTKGFLMEDVLSQIKPFKQTHIMKYQEELKSLKEEDILEFVKNNKWVGRHLFMGEYLSEDKVKEELRDISEEEEKTEEIEFSKDIEEIIEIGSKLAFYRSYFVESFNMVSYEYEPVIKKLAEDNNLSWDDIMLFVPEEVIDLINSGKIPENFKERKEGFGVIWNREKGLSLVTGEELSNSIAECEEKIDYTKINELKGMVAYRSKEKIRGIVKIVGHATEISKLNKGEILVASETTPDYVVGMKIAKAIITNMGGITSHASIVSRELKIPCIIGTKISTKVLKDGDEVEVDAEKGIIKIIKKNV